MEHCLWMGKGLERVGQTQHDKDTDGHAANHIADPRAHADLLAGLAPGQPEA